MFKAKSYFEAKIGERVYQLICDSEAPLQELIDLLEMVKKQLQESLDAALAQQKKSQEEKPDGNI